MSERELIAETMIYAVGPDGNGFDIHMTVATPYQADTGEWACSVALSGLHRDSAVIRGVDSWQALVLAMRLARQLLSLFVEDGGKLFRERHAKEVSLNNLFWDEVSHVPEVPNPDGDLSPEEQARVDLLTLDELKAIDEAILANCSVQFQKVARVVGAVMNLNAAINKHIPDVFYAQRLYQLVDNGKLTSQGRLGYMRYCEVRLASSE